MPALIAITHFVVLYLNLDLNASSRGPFYSLLQIDEGTNIAVRVGVPTEERALTVRWAVAENELREDRADVRVVITL